jgi:3-oxoacyl-[acyl-carrier-protein] synthase III
MTNEPRAMREIHEIRERIYEETKNMTQEERAELTRRAAQEMIDKYGLKVKRRVPQDELKEDYLHLK